MTFKEEYEKFLQPSAERENFVYKSITTIPKDQIINNMRPITVDRPDGSKITYKVMPDYIMIDSIRIPMSGTTAQRVADYFGLSLPSAEVSKEIYKNADVKVVAAPLSGSGATIDGKKYSGNEVVSTGVGYAPFASNYNDKINKQLEEKGVDIGGDKIVSGFAKDIVAPAPNARTLNLHGLYDVNGNPIQGGNGQTPHNTSTHTEYCSFVRLVSPNVTITNPDGTSEVKSIDDVYKTGRYIPLSKKLPESNENSFEQLDSFLDKFQSDAHSRRRNIIKRALNFR